VHGIDTIVQRLEQANVAGDGQTDTIDIELVALQLVSVDPVDLGAGLGDHYITLQTGQSSMGTMAITFDNQDGGTFDSFFDVFFDLRFGGVNGPILLSDGLRMTSSDNEWGRIAPGGAVVLEDVNYLLNGTDTAGDFWPLFPVKHNAFGAGHHTVNTIPEPATLTLGLLGLGTAVSMLRRRKDITKN
jgi:hypothetical protein